MVWCNFFLFYFPKKVRPDLTQKQKQKRKKVNPVLILKTRFYQEVGRRVYFPKSGKVPTKSLKIKIFRFFQQMEEEKVIPKTIGRWIAIY